MKTRAAVALEKGKPLTIMDVELDEIVDALAHEHQAEQLASLTEEAA